MDTEQLIQGYRDAGTVRKEILYRESLRLLEQAYSQIRTHKELLKMAKDAGRQWREMYTELRQCLGSQTGTNGDGCKTGCCNGSGEN